MMERQSKPHVSAPLLVRPAAPNEGERLREIATAAKGYWEYDEDRVREWGASLDFSEDGLRGKEVYVAEVDGRIVGWAALIHQGELCWLDDLWIEPASIGTGIGSRLFRHTADRAAEVGARRMEWEAEPNAVGFYEKVGGHYLRDSEPTEWGRTLAVMGIDLA
jgi:GNAT superfamily N-acetyltransferase